MSKLEQFNFDRQADQEKFERLSAEEKEEIINESREKACLINEKIKSEETGNYIEAEKQLKAEYCQGLILHHHTDNEIKELSNEVKVNTLASSGITCSANVLMRYEKKTGLIEKSGNHRLIDLGSSNTLFYHYEAPTELEHAGIKEYVCVDLGIKNRDFFIREPASEYELERIKEYDPEYKEPEINDRLKIKCIHGEILDVLHTLPDDYANAWMTGLESGNVIKNYDKWGYAVLAELKRIVPTNGFIFTDNAVMDIFLKEAVPEFSKLLELLRKLKKVRDKYADSSEEVEIRKRKIKELEDEITPYKCKEKDPFNLGRYVVDAQQIGFRIYCDSMENLLYSFIIIVNTNKEVAGN